MVNKKSTPKKIILTTRNVAALKKKYPTTFKKLNEMIGNPAATTLVEELPYYNEWLQMHGYDNEEWFRARNRSMKSW